MKSARRLAQELKESCVATSVDLDQLAWVFEWLLEKIRERRDELRQEEGGECPAAWASFSRLFSDGAEFGPDAPRLTDRQLLSRFGELLTESLNALPPHSHLAKKITRTLQAGDHPLD